MNYKLCTKIVTESTAIAEIGGADYRRIKAAPGSVKIAQANRFLYRPIIVNLLSDCHVTPDYAEALCRYNFKFLARFVWLNLKFFEHLRSKQ